MYILTLREYWQLSSAIWKEKPHFVEISGITDMKAVINGHRVYVCPYKNLSNCDIKCSKCIFRFECYTSDFREYSLTV